MNYKLLIIFFRTKNKEQGTKTINLRF